MASTSARQTIIDTANRASMRHLTMRHLHRAVHIVRQRHLVGNDVLLAAGFNPHTGREGKRVATGAVLAARREEQAQVSLIRRLAVESVNKLTGRSRHERPDERRRDRRDDRRAADAEHRIRGGTRGG